MSVSQTNRTIFLFLLGLLWLPIIGPRLKKSAFTIISNAVTSVDYRCRL